VNFSDSVVRKNTSDDNGGGLENSGFRVTFERLLITGNRAEIDGGGIYNSSSGPFTILDTTVEKNNALSGGGLANAPDNDLIVKRSLFLRNTARHPGISEDGNPRTAGSAAAETARRATSAAPSILSRAGPSSATASGARATRDRGMIRSRLTP
jgi:hypothetical protein